MTGVIAVCNRRWRPTTGVIAASNRRWRPMTGAIVMVMVSITTVVIATVVVF